MYFQYYGTGPFVGKILCVIIVVTPRIALKGKIYNFFLKGKNYLFTCFRKTMRWFKNPIDRFKSVEPKMERESVKFESYPDCLFGITS